ncbi:MAG TPA: heavy metal translocating P-type ATPase [Pedobacter sp.]|jgi:Cu2+-exporting ATPase
MNASNNIVKANFPVTGLSCASCAVSAETILQSQKGVVNAAVNFANSSATVEYTPSLVKPSELKTAVQSVGYDLIIEESDSAKTTLESMKKAKFQALERNTWLAILSSIPIVALGMFFMNMPYNNYIQWALATPVVLIFGRQFFINAWKQAKHGQSTMDTLVALSTGIAYLFSVFNTLYPQFWIDRGLEAHVYFEAASVVIAFILLGRLLEENAKSNTSEAIKKLMGLQPKTVTQILNGIERVVPLEEVEVNAVLLVKPGEKVPLDGKVISGSSYVDESMISGEPVPVLKEKGAGVFAGTINQKGSFQFVAEKVGKDTLLAQIIKLVQNAQGSKAPVQKMVDKVAGIFVPVVIGISILSLFSWIVLGGYNGFTQGLLAMVTVLVIACPCALGLATPTAIMVGVGKGAENGILIKDAESLEEAKNINAIILDKTGTITEGKPEVIAIEWLAGVNEQELSEIILSIESQSEHPLAEAVVQHLRPQNIKPRTLESFESLTGEGVFASVNGEAYFLGSPKLMVSNAIVIDDSLLQKAEEWLYQAYTVIWLANKENALAVIAIADKIKGTSAEAIKALQDMNIDVYMLTGDNEKTAQAVAKQVGILNYRAETLPSGKSNFIKELQREGKKVAMVGDGINDSEALAVADVSIAMGKGTDIAMDVAKMTLISSNLLQIPKAIHLSRKTVKIIRQNLFWAFIYNIIGIPLAAGVLYPFTGYLLNPMLAGGAMALSSLSVVANSLRLKYTKI